MLDDRGVAMRLAAPATRVVTLAPHLTEIAFAAGLGERLVGIARFSDFPAAATRLPQVGDGARVDIERVLALRPDLVLAWRSGNQAGDIRRLEALGVRVFVTEPRRLADIPRLLRRVGALSGVVDRADQAAASFERDVDELREKYDGRSPVRVFYEIWHRPLLTVSGRHMISDVITLCGGVNVFAESPLLTPSVSMESLLAARPEAIVGGSSAVGAGDFAAQWRRYPVKGLRDVPAFYVAPDHIQRQTPRIVIGARAICEALQKVRGTRR